MSFALTPELAALIVQLGGNVALAILTRLMQGKALDGLTLVDLLGTEVLSEVAKTVADALAVSELASVHRVATLTAQLATSQARVALLEIQIAAKAVP